MSRLRNEISKASPVGSPDRTIYQSQSMPRSNHRDRRKIEDAERKHADMPIARDAKIEFQHVLNYLTNESLKWR